MEERIKYLQKIYLTSVWGLSCLSLLSLILTRELELLTTLAIVTLFPFLYYFESRNRLKKIPWLENSLIIILFLVSTLRILVLNDSFLMVVADFLTAFLLLKCSFKKDRDDLTQMIALSFFILLSSSTLALDFTFLFSLTAYIFAAAWTLSLMTLSESSQPHQNLPSQTIKNDEKLQEIRFIFRHLRKNSWLTLGCAGVLAFSIFIFFPRLSLAVFQGAFLSPAHKTGFTEKVILEKSGEIFKDPTIAMRIEMIGETGRKNWPGTIRGRTLSHFNGRQWTPGPLKKKLKVIDAYKTRVLKIRKLVQSRFQVFPMDKKKLKSEYSMKLNNRSYIRQKIYLESLDTLLLFGMPWIESVTIRLPELWILEDHSLVRPYDFKGRVSYEVRSLVERPSERILLKKSSEKSAEDPDQNLPGMMTDENSESESPDNLQLPDESRSVNLKKIGKLAKKITVNKTNPFIKAKKIENYLREKYRYTLKIKGTDRPDPLDDFLFSSKEGHCEYFASAMVVMLRLEGIPSRMVTGFIMDERNAAGNYYVVRSQDAHTWVEAYLGGIWQEFDPSPRERRFESVKASFWKKLGQKIDYLNFLWNAHILGYDMESQKKIAKNIELKSGHFSRALDQKANRWKDRWLKSGFQRFRHVWRSGRENQDVEKERLWTPARVILLPLILILMVRYRRMLYRILKIFLKQPQSKTRHSFSFYGEMLEIFSKNGLSKNDGETPLEFSDRIVRTSKSSFQHSRFRKSLRLLTHLFCQVKYAHIPLTKKNHRMIKSSLEILKNYFAHAGG